MSFSKGPCPQCGTTIRVLQLSTPSGLRDNGRFDDDLGRVVHRCDARARKAWQERLQKQQAEQLRAERAEARNARSSPSDRSPARRKKGSTSGLDFSQCEVVPTPKVKRPKDPRWV